jgi:RNA polymerase sigma-70 factor (ECF subfamily)
MLINGSVGAVLAPGGRLFRAVQFTFDNDKIVAVDIVADPARLRSLALGVLEI